MRGIRKYGYDYGVEKRAQDELNSIVHINKAKNKKTLYLKFSKSYPRVDETA